MADTSEAWPAEGVGNYLVETKIGQGGHASVFLALDVVAHRRVAIKIARDSTARLTSTIAREVAIMERLRHDGVPRVYETGTLRDGRAYSVVEWISGKTVRDLMNDGPVALLDALVLAERVAGVLSALHTAGYLHRDIKPSNLIVPTDEGASRFHQSKVIDFGICVELARRSLRGRRQTSTGWVSGTTDYMAPEQLLGRPQTPQTDLFALAAILYELLVGHPPMTADGGVSQYQFQVGGQDFKVAVVPRRLTSEIEIPGSANVPPSVSALLRASLSRDAEQRPGAVAFRAQVRRALRECATAPPCSGRTRAAS
jgi:serine/threonine-protein kinase